MLRISLGLSRNLRQQLKHPKLACSTTQSHRDLFKPWTLTGLRFYTSDNDKKNVTSEKLAKPLSAITKRENIWTVPNISTITRLLAAPCIGYLVVQHSYSTASGLMIYASITDFIDGYLARKYNNQTIFGSIADPAADKALLVTLASCLTYSGAIPWWCGAAILGRDIALAISAFIIRWHTSPPPKTASRYFDFSLPSVKVTPTTISKWNTFFQMIYLSICIANPVIPIFSTATCDNMALLVTGTTVWSGLSYVFSKTAVKRL